MREKEIEKRWKMHKPLPIIAQGVSENRKKQLLNLFIETASAHKGCVQKMRLYAPQELLVYRDTLLLLTKLRRDFRDLLLLFLNEIGSFGIQFYLTITFARVDNSGEMEYIQHYFASPKEIILNQSEIQNSLSSIFQNLSNAVEEFV